jgi:serine/threonine protein kinase
VILFSGGFTLIVVVVANRNILFFVVAPEVLNGESQCMPQTDTWNVGLLIYILLSGVSPFLGDTEEDTKQNVTYLRFRFEHLHKTVTQEATRFIMLIFKRSPL